MGSQPEQDATSEDYARLGVTVSDEQIATARDRARRTLADMDAKWTPAKWAQLDDVADTAA